MNIRTFASLFCIMAWPLAAAEPEPVGAPATPRLGFVTSVTGSLAFGTWPDAGGQVGLAAADHICSTRANIAGLPDAASFVAWLSDSQDDAWCRVQGLSGKRAANCGQPTPPALAGPWQGTNGQPLLAALPDGLGATGIHYTALRHNEFGQPLAGSWEPIPTGTDVDGVAAGLWCDDWTNPAAAGSVTLGGTNATTQDWTQQGTAGCTIPNRRLYCLQAGPGPSLGRQRWGRLAFVTTTTGSGHLATWPQAGGAQGVPAGDNVCRAEAAAAGLPHAATFKAWLADRTGGTGSALRFQHDGPWRRVDGVRIADSIANLSSGRLQAPINQTLDGSYLALNFVWTGTNSNGSANLNCDGWTSTANQGVPGLANHSNSSWTFLSEGPCDEFMRLYCLSDSDELFVDGHDAPGLP